MYIYILLHLVCVKNNSNIAFATESISVPKTNNTDLCVLLNLISDEFVIVDISIIILPIFLTVIN